MNILIVGYGVVGKNLAKELECLHPDIYDKYKVEHNTKKDKLCYDLVFICVDTPLLDDYSLDTTEVENAILENSGKIYVIKSTVPIGTVDQLKFNTQKRIVFSPEYYGNTQHCNNYNFDFTILGGYKADCVEVIQVLQQCYDGRHQFKITDSKTAELVKFMENSFLATKVSFCNQFYELSEKYNISYEELRELFLLDNRVNPSHTFVYRDKPYWDTHCLNKDVPYIAYKESADFLKGVCEYNQRAIKKIPIKLSIIIPYYQTYDLTVKLLEVLKKQVNESVEVILVDDGCNETRLDIYDFVNIIHLDQNYGASHAWNVGLDNASGKYIGFIDSDDMIEDNYIEVLIDAIDKNLGDEIVFDFHLVSEDRIRKRPNCRAIWKAIYIKWLVCRFNEDLKYNTDMPLQEHLKETAHNKAYLDKVLYHYNDRREGSITWKKMRGLFKEEEGK